MDALLLAASLFAICCASASLAAVSFYLRGLTTPTEASPAAVTIILPATGSLPGFDNLVADLARQILPPLRLIVAVESKVDPAYERVRAVQATSGRLIIDLVVAGQTVSSGQKSANILAALEKLGPEDEYILLMDADIRPQSWYVAALINPLAAGRHDMVNGYRWLTPQRASLFAGMIAALDRRIAVLPRPERIKLIWGGSIAVTPRALAALDLPATLAGHVSDDLRIGARAASVGLDVWARRSARAPTPLSNDPRRLLAFGRRQLQLVRIYRPGLWSIALAISVADLGCRLALIASAAGAWFLSPALAALVAVAALDWLSAELRLYVSQRLGVADTRGFRIITRLFALALLPLPLLWSALLCASSFGSRIAWAHATYTVDNGGRVLRVERASAYEPGDDESVGFVDASDEADASRQSVAAPTD